VAGAGGDVEQGGAGNINATVCLEMGATISSSSRKAGMWRFSSKGQRMQLVVVGAGGRAEGGGVAVGGVEHLMNRYLLCQKH
jgi:hypothetical protein